ncbi:ATP-dependent DNA helicase RecG [Fonticella tunisiensis]|uniref:ATP-dependent DNA helicase RecG n=1 Tax=Fonticella tunisiensis TaxID=1096341 RepID=A0A4R7KR57_9CLOT|nr:ATP-dependent DNA helicase RecG [Fonticella tunisiensis]TDT61626.1 ATP-dependent DNA helicase RecG [Fonticella tunisiensis]
MEIQYIKGVGPKLSKYLNLLGIYTVKDAIYYFPRDYEDRNNIKPVYDMVDGEMVSIIAEVSLIYPSKKTSTGKYLNRIIFKNSSGYIVGVWFNQPYIKNTFKVGERVLLYGKVSKRMGEVQLIEPQYEKNPGEAVGGINPIYPINKYVSQKVIRKIIYQSLLNVEKEVSEFLPENLRKIYNIPDIVTALKNVHFPADKFVLKLSIDRIKFEELLVLQLGLIMAKNQLSVKENAYPIPVCKEMKEFKDALPFNLTGAQSKCIREILTDMKKTKPMNRLVQGDVGSGKTIVAIIAMFNCAMNGFQSAMMAPTEILAEQHYHSITGLLNRWGITAALLTGSMTKREKDEVLKRIASGEIDIVVGTHALIQENVEFKKLALVITDEQHRFGVRQRAELISKGHNPHVLVMTATPIPRTLALFMYGDMDISIINELPPGRQKVDTYFIRPAMKNRAYDFVKTEIEKGRQAYVVCSLVEESEKLEAESAVETAEFLSKNYFKDYNVGLLHGKMNPKEKDEVMNKFKNGEIHVLVSTTVVEVGVNVPNATVMVIENADRFGLAQLHQLRGRVGRGQYKSYCILIAEAKTNEAVQRMDIMTKTNDGFVIAEKDMELRGTGEFFGTKQHGLPELKMADLVRDIEIVKKTRDIARELVETGKIFESEYELLRREVNNKFGDSFDYTMFN